MSRLTAKHVVQHMNIKEEMTLNELVSEMGKAGCLGAGKLAKAVDIYEEMLKEKATIFMGIAGVVSPAGYRQVIVELIKRRMVNAIVSTGANIVHDLIEAFGGAHYIGSCKVSDKKLRSKHINRIYDIFLPNSEFNTKLARCLEEVLNKFEGGVYSIKDFLGKIGENLPEDNMSILYNASKYKVPIFVPAIQDSGLGLILWKIKQEKRIIVDAFEDLADFFELIREADKLGVIILGGGVPKNFILQGAYATKKPINYAIQITMDRPETGGLSGATLEEAISWGKISREAKYVQVICDFNICMPIIVAAVIERLGTRDV